MEYFFTALLRKQQPIAFVLQSIWINWASTVVSVGAICGITSVLLVGLFGQTGVFFAIARWAVAGNICKDTRNIMLQLLVLQLLVILGRLLLHLFLTDVVPLVNIGTLAAFIVVSFAAIILRKTQPDIQRHFKTLLVPMIPAITIVFCILLVFELPTIT